MAKKKSDKKISTLEASFEDVLVCRKESAKTMLEIFVAEPENISQENLGTLAGILEITDESDDSSYIVNYLISVLKKEYFSRTKRGSIESFEAALNKANLALAKLAEHDNVNWLGKINAIILAIEKNNIHISQAGSAKTLLLRGKSLTDITDGAQVPVTPSPFKTFIDVLSGRIEKDDKLIIATDAIFEIFSFEEIKRSALKFSGSDFIRFLKTALGNELDRAAVLIASIREKELPEKKPIATKKEVQLNAFSQKAYAKNTPKEPKKETPKDVLKDSQKETLVTQIKKDLEKESDEFIDKKTGHIYIKENYNNEERSHIMENIIEISQIKFGEFFTFLSQKMASFKQYLASLNFSHKIKARGKQSEDIPVVVEKSKEPKKPFLDKEKILIIIKKSSLIAKKWLAVALSFIISISQKMFTGAKTFIPKKEPSPSVKNITSKGTVIFQKIIPRFSKVKKTFSALDYSQKIYASLAIVFLLVVPYFIAKIQSDDTQKEPIEQEIVPSAPLALENDTNVSRVEKLDSAFSKDGILKTINLNGEIFFLTKSGLTNAQDNQNYPFPANMNELKIATNMDDLNLIFLIDSDNKITSWSPVSKKFQPNTIEIPAGANITQAKTYLTYIYLMDEDSNQIYRYPRADSGFGEKTAWLKESLSLNEISSIAIGENLYLAKNGEILKFLQGKKQDFSLEETATPIFANEIYTKRDSQNIFILDNKNSRIIKLSLEGKIISQYYNLEISSATDFEINEEKNTAYFSNGNEVKRFEMK